MKNILFITMLLGAGYSECNESNWEEYYPDMQGCNLSGADLMLANLSDANLSDANLSEAYLSYASLFNANLTYAYLYEAGLSWAYLYEADLSWANLSYAYLYGADLSEANLSCANLSYAYLSEANLDNTIWDECGITDDNADGYDDESYDAGFDIGAMSGDANLDGTLDVLDIVTFIEMIMNTYYYIIFND